MSRASDLADASITPLGDAEVALVRRRTRVVLIAGQILSGVGMGATLSAGALLATRVSGDEAWSGMAATMTTIGAASVAVPLAALARARGRRVALSTGALVAALGGGVGLLAAILDLFPLLLLGFAMIGVGTAVNLQTRFAATDLAQPEHRGRDLALVVWATTVGAIAGPNLIAPADATGLALGLPELAGPFLFTIAAQLLAAGFYTLALRPDPLRLAHRLLLERPAPILEERAEDRAGIIVGLVALGFSHATMVSVMSMTPVHLTHHGADLVIVGVTISLHVAGMFALSPVFGILADRLGRAETIAIGQLLLLASLVVTGVGAESTPVVVVGLVLLGLGWSASTVAASSLVSASAAPARRTVIQGRADLVMGATGALGGASAGLVLAAVGYAGLAFGAILLVAGVLVALAVRALARGARIAA
ncbi:MAG: MFS transporter [Actinomycetales bacterium]|nr:MFS transporter [Actinomycetales bacterium]